MPRRKFTKKRRPAFRRATRKPAYKRMLGHANSALDRVPGVVGGTLRLMRNFINVETHYSDVGDSHAIKSDGTDFLHLANGIATGDDFNTRSGRSVLLKQFQMKWALAQNASATNTFVHLALCVDKKPDSATAASHDAVYGTGSTYLSMIDRAEEGDRFVILRQFTVALDQKSSPTAHGELFVKLDGIHTLYDGTAATYADIEKNALILVAVSNEATNTPTLTLNTRVSWYDN